MGPDPVQPGSRLLFAVFMESGPCFQPDVVPIEEMCYLRQVIHDANISINCCNVIESMKDFIVSL